MVLNEWELDYKNPPVVKLFQSLPEMWMALARIPYALCSIPC